MPEKRVAWPLVVAAVLMVAFAVGTAVSAVREGNGDEEDATTSIRRVGSTSLGRPAVALTFADEPDAYLVTYRTGPDATVSWAVDRPFDSRSVERSGSLVRTEETSFGRAASES